MGRIRTIKPEFPQSESIVRLSRDARLLFIQIWTFVDDSGRARASSRMLASLLYPYDDDAPGLIDGWLDELERQDHIKRYAVEGATYLQVTNWRDHQKIDRPSPSRLPEFVEGSRVLAESSRAIAEDSPTDLGPRTLDLGSTTKIKPLSPQAPTGDANGDANAIQNASKPDTKPLQNSDAPKKPRTPRNADPESDPRHAPFKAKLDAYWKHTNGGDEMPWGPADARALKDLLDCTPSLTEYDFRRMLNNRAKSEGLSHSIRVYSWIRTVTQYASGPLNRFKQPIDGNGRHQPGLETRTPEEIAEADAKRDEDERERRETELSYWKNVWLKRPVQFEREAPKWIKEALTHANA
jgi:hypothetical protein